MRVLDLFSGMGGLGTGFSSYFNVETAIDWDKDSCDTYSHNHPDTHVYPKDIVDIEFTKKDYDGIIGIVGGSPCQDFSILNKNRDSNSKRANLIFEMIRSTKQIKPNFVLIENVVNVPKEYKLKLIKELEELNYKVVAKIVNASDFGSVQLRRRWVLVASKNKHIYPKPINTNRMAREILRNKKSEIKARSSTLNKIKQLEFGQWDALPGDKWKSYFVVDPNKLLPAIANPTKLRYIKPDRSGYLSLTELILSQGFPEDYAMHGNLSSKGQQIANAVPVELAQQFAKAIKEAN